MLKLEIPGRGAYVFKNLLLDLNGTLAVDGELAAETLSLLNQAGEILQVHILTADTWGRAAELKQKLKGEIHVFAGENIGAAKAEFIDRLGPEATIAVGNGDNDAAMLRKAAIAIAVLGTEGCSVRALQCADLFVKEIRDALMLILKPRRLLAGLRS